MIKDNFTIVIPCKNEERYIGRTLLEISAQRWIKGTRVIIADGGSTDRTLQIINKFKQILDLQIEVVEGGSVSQGRNRGAALVDTEFIVFVDADSRFFNSKTFKITDIIRRDYDLITCKLCCSSNAKADFMFKIFNKMQEIMKETFSTGTYMAVRTSVFRDLGGFDETLNHSEDYFFSRKIPRERFRILNCKIGQDDRRFKKFGYFGMIKFMIKNYLNRNNIEHFRKDANYW